MELEACDRDQTLYACAAQDPKLLPKKRNQNSKKEAGEKIKQTVGSVFDHYYKQVSLPSYISLDQDFEIIIKVRHVA